FLFSAAKAWRFRPKFPKIERRPKTKPLTLRDKKLKERWEELMRKVDYESVESLKATILDADKLVNEVLKRLGLEGQHMGERIELISEDDYASLSALWTAHRFRNNIVNTPGFEVAPEEAKEAIEGYHAFLKEIGVL
ncbi:MAG: hypothetical protein AAB967_03160, partial [Patescibacteria group bacterium]